MIQRQIRFVRGHKVLPDSVLAELYGVKTKALLQAVKRNLSRFPGDFMFTLTAKEWVSLNDQEKAAFPEEKRTLRSQIVTSKERRGGRRYAPHVFTEQGVAMLSSVLKSERAIDVNVAIMRAFVQARRLLATHHELAAALVQLQRKFEGHESDIDNLYEAVRQLLGSVPPKGSGEMGFHTLLGPGAKS